MDFLATISTPSGRHVSRFLSSFEDLARVGKGSFCEVIRCRSRMDGCVYAVKCSKDQVAARSKAAVQAQLREVFALSALGDAPHVLRYFSAWREDGFLYVQMEIAWGSVEDAVLRRHPLVHAQPRLRRKQYPTRGSGGGGAGGAFGARTASVEPEDTVRSSRVPLEPPPAPRRPPPSRRIAPREVSRLSEEWSQSMPSQDGSEHDKREGARGRGQQPCTVGGAKRLSFAFSQSSDAFPSSPACEEVPSQRDERTPLQRVQQQRALGSLRSPRGKRAARPLPLDPEDGPPTKRQRKDAPVKEVAQTTSPEASQDSFPWGLPVERTLFGQGAPARSAPLADRQPENRTPDASGAGAAAVEDPFSPTDAPRRLDFGGNDSNDALRKLDFDNDSNDAQRKLDFGEPGCATPRLGGSVSQSFSGRPLQSPADSDDMPLGTRPRTAPAPSQRDPSGIMVGHPRTESQASDVSVDEAMLPPAVPSKSPVMARRSTNSVEPVQIDGDDARDGMDASGPSSAGIPHPLETQVSQESAFSLEPASQPGGGMGMGGRDDAGSLLPRRCLTDLDIRLVALHMARALAALHTRGLVHMDVKPGNILVSYGSGPGMCDSDGKFRPEVQYMTGLLSADVRLKRPIASAADVEEEEEEAEEENVKASNSVHGAGDEEGDGGGGTGRPSVWEPGRLPCPTYKLGDFGLAGAATSTSWEEGDARYLPKELLNSPNPDLRAADLFSLGASLYELAVGEALPTQGPRYHALRSGDPLSWPDDHDREAECEEGGGADRRFRSNGREMAGPATRMLIAALMHPDPRLRPAASELLCLPFLVSAELQSLAVASGRVSLREALQAGLEEQVRLLEHSPPPMPAPSEVSGHGDHQHPQGRQAATDGALRRSASVDLPASRATSNLEGCRTHLSFDNVSIQRSATEGMQQAAAARSTQSTTSPQKRVRSMPLHETGHEGKKPAATPQSPEQAHCSGETEISLSSPTAAFQRLYVSKSQSRSPMDRGGRAQASATAWQSPGGEGETEADSSSRMMGSDSEADWHSPHSVSRGLTFHASALKKPPTPANQGDSAGGHGRAAPDTEVWAGDEQRHPVQTPWHSARGYGPLPMSISSHAREGAGVEWMSPSTPDPLVALRGPAAAPSPLLARLRSNYRRGHASSQRTPSSGSASSPERNQKEAMEDTSESPAWGAVPQGWKAQQLLAEVAALRSALLEEREHREVAERKLEELAQRGRGGQLQLSPTGTLLHGGSAWRH